MTGSSTADVIVLLVDARKGVVEQTRRHLAVASLLRVPHVVLVVNKIDLVDYSEDVFTIATDFALLARSLGALERTASRSQRPRATMWSSDRTAPPGTTGRLF